MCNGRSVNFVQKNFDQLKTVDIDNTDFENETLVLSSISSYNYSTNKCNDWFEKLLVNNSQILIVKLDTGAQCNVLPLNEFKHLGLNGNCLRNSNLTLCNYNGSRMKVVGKCILKCKTNKGVEANILFQVVETSPNATSVLGLNTLTALNLVQRVEAVTCNDKLSENVFHVYSDLFTGIGDLKNFIYDIKLQHNAVGKIEPCRKIPVSLLDPLKKELIRMQDMKVIKKVEEPTEFVSSLVIVKKSNGSLRICLDPQHLNQQILREHYYMPTFEEIVSRMPGAQVFSILDANKAFWQIQLSHDSAEYTTFNTPFGRYCFLRMPYGICSAPEVFHRAFSEVFKDIPGVEIYIDDILIWGQNQREHDLRLKAVLNRAREYNVRFNKEKSQIGLPEVTYLGHTFSKEGLKPDDNKIKAVLGIRPPSNVKELETFLGMITYVSKFIPNVSDKTSVLRDLLRKNTVWTWDSVHDKAFNDIKEILSKKPVLQFYDTKREITLSVDASQFGLGAVILQNGLPVAYASKALTDTQKNYAQIEKETLAIVFGCEKFHQYLYGRTFTIESDHKPLEAIFKKPLNKSPLRLQRMRIRLQPYSFNLIYKSGKELLLADALSRTCLEDSDDFFRGDVEAHVGLIVKSLPVSDEVMKKFRIETEKDETLQLVKAFVKDGWPMAKSQVPDRVVPYFYFREELSEAQGILFKNSCIIVPESLRKDMLNRIHYTHLGIEKCKNRARELLFWPGMSKAIEDLVKNCVTCLRFQKANMKESLIPKEIPNVPWQVLGVDLFHFHGKEYLLVVDYFSKFVEIEFLRDTTSRNVIDALKAMFSRYGIPETVFSDNGPQFSSKLFKEFSSLWNFQHKTSSPLYPQSNGMAERHIQTIKTMLHKALDENKDIYLTLLEYKNIPISNELESPAEIMFGRKIKGILPHRVNVSDRFNKIKQQLLLRQEYQKENFDRKAIDLKPLSSQDKVFIYRERKPHEKAVVLEPAQRPRSYKLLKEDGRVIERNRRDILRGSSSMDFQVKEEPGFSDVETDNPGKMDDQILTDTARRVPTPTDLTAHTECTTSGRELASSDELPRRTRSGRIIT